MTHQSFANITAGSARQLVGTWRAYRRSYQGTRLLYSATFVEADASARR